MADWRRGTFRAEEVSGTGDVTALATECLSEAGASCTCINLGKQCRVGGGVDDEDEEDEEQREDPPPIKKIRQQ